MTPLRDNILRERRLLGEQGVWKSCGIHLPSAWVPVRWPPSDWLDFWSTWQGPFWIWPRNLWAHFDTCQQARVAQTGTQTQKEKVLLLLLLGCCLSVSSVGLFSWLADIFILLGKLAGKHEYVCNVHLSKMSPFWLKWNWDHRDQKKTRPPLPTLGWLR